MDKIDKIAEQAMMKSPEPTQKHLVKKDDHSELSIYDDTLTLEGTKAALKRLVNAYPGLTEGFHSVFSEMIIEEGFTDQRLIDSVNHVIKTCEYPQPTIAKFLSFDQKVKLYDHAQLTNMKDYEGKWFTYFSRLESGYYASNKEIKKYNLK